MTPRLTNCRGVPHGAARSVLLIATVLCAATLLTFAMAPQKQEKPQTSIAQFFPHGAILYLEARDLSSLLRDWSSSRVKSEWLASENYAEFAQSRLFLRLQEAQKEFASAAGIPVDSQLLLQAAGTQSAIAIYDIGELHFLYISKIDSASAMRSALWQSRGKFEPRRAAGAQFFVKNNGTNREVAFTIDGDSLLLATQEQLLAGALEARHVGSEPTLANERWFSSAINAPQEPGDLRLVLNMPEIAKSPHFRSYWIQRNVSNLKQYSAAISDLYRERGGFREERVLLRNADTLQDETPRSQQTGEQAAAALANAAGTEFGMSRAVANPSTDDVASLILEKLLAPKTAAAVENTSAPIVSLTDRVTGSAEDLETRIDAPVRRVSESAEATELRQLIDSAGVNAILLGQSSRANAASGFVHMQSLIVLNASHAWEIAAAQKALNAAIEDLSSNRFGLSWVDTKSEDGDTFQLDGRFPLYIAARGNFLFLANSRDALRTLSSKKLEATSGTAINSASRISFQAERTNFMTLSRAIDGANFRPGLARNKSDDSTPALTGSAPGGFLSANVGSLVRVFRGIASETVTRRESAGKTLESVYYEFER